MTSQHGDPNGRSAAELQTTAYCWLLAIILGGGPPLTTSLNICWSTSNGFGVLPGFGIAILSAQIVCGL